MIRRLDRAALAEVCPALDADIGAAFLEAVHGPAGTFVAYRPQGAIYIKTMETTPRYVFRERDGDDDEDWSLAEASTAICLLAIGALPLKRNVKDHFILDVAHLATRELALADLARWPLLPMFLRSDDDFRGAYHGPGGVFMVCLASMVGELDQQRHLVMTMRGEVREIVWLYIEPHTSSWRSAEYANAIAHALAAGTIETTQNARGEWIVDEFEADRVDD